MADTAPNNKNGQQQQQQQKQTTMEWARQKYNEQYEAWMPWIEDVFLKYFTKDNRTSYVARDGLDRTKVTGIDQVDSLQDKTNDLVAGQVGQGGLLQPVGDAASAGLKAVDPRKMKSMMPGSGSDDKREENENGKKGLSVPGASALGL